MTNSKLILIVGIDIPNESVGQLWNLSICLSKSFFWEIYGHRTWSGNKKDWSIKHMLCIRSTVYKRCIRKHYDILLQYIQYVLSINFSVPSGSPGSTLMAQLRWRAWRPKLSCRMELNPKKRTCNHLLKHWQKENALNRIFYNEICLI